MIPRRPLLLAGVLLLVAACSGRAGIDDPLQSALEATPARPTVPSTCRLFRAVPVPETDKPTATEEPAVTQTDTEWGRIWDALPAGFPVYPDAVETEEAGAGEPVSATFSTPAAADEIATWLQSRLELATFSTVASRGRSRTAASCSTRWATRTAGSKRPSRRRVASRSSPSATARTARSNSVAPAQHTEPNRRPYCRWIGRESDLNWPWGGNVQSTQPRDVAALIFVIGLFAVLLVVSLTIGSPTR